MKWKFEEQAPQESQKEIADMAVSLRANATRAVTAHRFSSAITSDSSAIRTHLKVFNNNIYDYHLRKP
jgi:hypothetical protein